MKKHLLILLSGIGFLLIWTGCNTNDDENVDVSTSIDMEFVLLNSDDNQTDVFMEGDDICFNLTLQNKSGMDLTLNVVDLFGIQSYFKGKETISMVTEDAPYQSIFAVYTSTGKYVGCAWSNLALEEIKIRAGQKLSLRSSWLDTKRWSPLIFINTQENSFLPAGNYYAIIKARYRADSFVTFRKDFTVNAHRENLGDFYGIGGTGF